MSEYKVHGELAKDNPNGLDELPVCHNFSSNPGFFGASTGALAAGRGTAVQRPATRPQQSVVGSGNTMGRSANRGFGSVSNPAPGSVDPTSEGGPLTLTSGYGG